MNILERVLCVTDEHFGIWGAKTYRLPTREVYSINISVMFGRTFSYQLPSPWSSDLSERAMEGYTFMSSDLCFITLLQMTWI